MTSQHINMVDANLSSSPTRAGRSGRSSPAGEPSSTTDMSHATMEGGSPSQGGIGHQDSKEPLEEYDWEKLEERFNLRMDERQVAETEIYKEFNTLLAVRQVDALRNPSFVLIQIRHLRRGHKPRQFTKVTELSNGGTI